MTISNASLRAQHDGDGTSTAFAFSMPVSSVSSIRVISKVESTGVETVETEGSTINTTLSGTPAGSTGGTVNYVTPPPTGTTVSIILDPPLTQGTALPLSGEFPSTAVEAALDKLTNLAKRTRDMANRSLRLFDGDKDGSGRYDANTNRIVSLGDPVDNQDAATKAHVAAKVANVSSTAADVISASGPGYRIEDLRYLIPDTGAVAVDLETRLGQTKSVTDFGATGDAATDDTAAVQAAVDAGGWIFFPAGTYMMDEVTISDEVHIVIAPDAILKQRSGTSSTDQAILKFAAGSDYSSVQGGQFDGDRSTLAASYTDEVWTAIRTIGGPSHLRFQDIYIHDFCHTGWYHGSGDDSTYRDILVKSCGKGCIHQGANQGTIENVTFEDIGNNGEAIFQHATEIRDASDFTISNVRVVDFQPDGSGLEPKPLAFAFERMTAMNAQGLIADGFSGTGNPGMGFIFDSVRESSIRGVVVRGGYEQGGSIQTCFDTTISDSTIDLGYESALGGDGIGVRVRGGGLYPAIGAGAVAENARALDGSRNLLLSNILVSRAATQGFLIQSARVTLSHCRAVGCDAHGFYTNQNLTDVGTFEGSDPVIVEYVDFIGCVSEFNALAGLNIEEGTDISVIGGTYANNGSDTTGGTNRSGIRIQANAARVRLIGPDVGDTQTWSTKTDGASFEPGSTSGDQYAISLVDPNQVQVGQYLTLSDAGGAGTDATGRVVSKTRDDIMFEVSGGFTFAEHGGITSALTGTFSTSGTTLTGAGSSLNSEVLGRTYVKDAAGTWKRVIRVNSATSGIIESGFSSDISAETLTKLQVDVDPVSARRQQNGVRVESGASEVYARGVVGSVASALWSMGGDGTEFAEGSEVFGVALATTAVASATSIALPAGFPLVRITGTNAIQTITAKSSGYEVKLIFASTADLTHGTGNLILNGAADWTTIAANDTITLVCDGTNWIEVARSDNS